MDLRLLRYFLTVVEEGSISRAASRLEIAQSAVSRAMQTLEATLGVSLLVRTSRSATPTDAGSVLADEARVLLERVNAAAERTRTAGSLGRHIRCATAPGDAHLAVELAAAFRGQADDVSAEVVSGNPGTLLGILRVGDCDAVLIRGPFDNRGLDQELVSTEPRVVLLARNHPLAEQPRLHISQLRDEPITIWPAMSGAEREHWAGADLDRHAWRAGPTNVTAIDVKLNVQLGRAIAFVQQSLFPDGSDPLGICVRPVDGIAPSSLHLVWPMRSTSLALADFVRHVGEQTAALRPDPEARSGTPGDHERVQDRLHVRRGSP